LLAWHWQRDGYPWAGLVQKPASSAPAVAAAPAPSQASSPPVVIPVEPTANPAAPETQPASGETTQPPADESSTSNAMPGNPAAKPAEPAAQSNDASAANVVAGKTPAVESPQTSSPETREPEESAAATRKVAPKPSPAASVAPAATFEDRLVADGERYLYGRGVPEDCERAQRNLQIAARQSNAKAQTLLGAMYATGHCVGRDLPNSYRWFAKALHGDPGNSRVQRDLEVLWKQMTPEERLLAMKNQ
jgi:TPR repeat protein